MYTSGIKPRKTYYSLLAISVSLVLALTVAFVMADYRMPKDDLSRGLPAASQPLPIATNDGSNHRAGSMRHPQTQFDNEFARLDALVRSKNLPGLIAAADDIEHTWGKTGGQDYGRLMLEVSNALTNFFDGDEAYELSQKYATRALAKADTFSLRLETILLGFLTRDLALSASASQNATQLNWRKERRVKAKLWLHAWRRLEKRIDRSFDFSEPPSLNVSPPTETGLPPGASPDAIKDEKLRARYKAALSANAKKSEEYNDQMELRNLDKSFPNKAEEYLVRVYSEPPYDLDELRRYLIAYGLNESTTKRMEDEVMKRISQAKSKPE
ncbi:MAG TPA: hypothetical protein VFH31_21045 [Pyrinomonadaceae bacterium]|nr:hypothetical protein [Pyrinomonadaceae bacterium]